MVGTRVKETGSVGFNRTFLVLKSGLRALERRRALCFNRTFLVLKLEVFDFMLEGAEGVLIAPFWY